MQLLKGNRQKDNQWFTIQGKVHSGIINLFDERIVYSPDKDSVCSKRGTTEIL